MTNKELVNNIRESFSEIVPSASLAVIEMQISDIARCINRLRTDDKDKGLRLKRISTDLVKAYTSQVQYLQLRNRSEHPGMNVKAEFDATFFESVHILKEELFLTLEKS
jgi:hypothetical protein